MKESFLAALHAFLAQGGRGAKKKLAEAIGASSTQISDWQSGRKPLGPKVMARICAAYDKQLGEFLRIGEAIQRGEPFFPHLDRLGDVPDRETQARLIWDWARMDLGVSSQFAAFGYNSDDFIRGEISAAELYRQQCESLRIALHAGRERDL